MKKRPRQIPFPRTASRRCRRQSPICPPRPRLNSLGGRENYKFDHLDKTKDLSASAASKKPSHALVLVAMEAHAGKAPYFCKAKPFYPDGDLPRISRISPAISVGRLRPRRHKK